MISNPSDVDMSFETNQWAGNDSGDFHIRTASNSRSPRPLPPPPHSRMASGQQKADYSLGSLPGLAYPNAASADPSSTRRDSLNPYAKPFVFGARTSGSFDNSASIFEGHGSNSGVSFPAETKFGHSRATSSSKPLNAAAQEFKPSAFTFRPPPGVPQLAFPAPESTRPLPAPPSLGYAHGRAQQGREKRQRRGSSSSRDGGSEGGMDNLSSFKFPREKESPRNPPRPRSTSVSPKAPLRQSSLNAAAPPFTFSGFSTTLPIVSKELTPLPHSLIASAGSVDESLPDNVRESDLRKADSPIDLPIPPTFKPKRTPVPLDFKHHASSNTVPAGLFKALANSGDERTRRSVRSRMSSRNVLEHIQRPSLEHTRQPSLDDRRVPAIARKVSRSRLVNQLGSRSALEAPQVADDLFSPSVQRRSSLPPALPNSAHSTTSIASLPENPRDVQTYELRLETLLDEKIEAIRREIIQYTRALHDKPNTSTEAMITEVVSLFRAQLQESAARGLEESQMDARGELDFELIKDVVQQGHAENRALLQHELNEIMNRLSSQIGPAGGPSGDMMPLIEEFSSRTIHMVASAMSQLSGRMESLENNRAISTQDYNSLLRALLENLTPTLTSLRSEPVDYEFLTDQLTQAVKPHISQLIDLASDKRETAGLIVDRLLPLLPSIPSAPVNVDTDSIVNQLTTEVRRAIAPIDAFEIKEQVADLVVERLDSRLAVRDQTFNVDTVTGKVTEGVGHLLEPIQNIADAMKDVVEGQNSISVQHGDILVSQKNVIGLLADLPSQLECATKAVHAVQKELLSRTQVFIQPDDSKSSVDKIANDQSVLSHQLEELLTLQRDVIDRVKTLPEALSASTSVLQQAHADFALSRDTTKRDIEEMRRLNTDLQVQLAKARGAHGQIRVEKDALNDKLKVIESDRDHMRSEIEELRLSATAQSSEAAAMEKRNKELEEALSQALSRLQASDVTAQTSQERITELEKVNREIGTEKQSLKSRVRIRLPSHLYSLTAVIARLTSWSYKRHLPLVTKKLQHKLFLPFRNNMTILLRNKATGMTCDMHRSKLRS
jgi:hypothetical protein